MSETETINHTPEHRSRVPDWVIAEEILNLLFRRGTECLSQIAAELVIPPSDVHRVLQKLENEALVTCATGGDAAATIGRSRWSLVRDAKPSPRPVTGERLRDHIRIDRLVLGVRSRLF